MGEEIKDKISIEVLVKRISDDTIDEKEKDGILWLIEESYPDFLKFINYKKLDKYQDRFGKIESINKFVCDYFLTTPNIAWAKTRKHHIVKVRQLIHFFCKKYTRMSYEDIGCYFEKYGGKKDHATVMHSCKTVLNIAKTDHIFRIQFEQMDSILRSRLYLIENPLIELTPEESKLFDLKENILMLCRESNTEESFKDDLISIVGDDRLPVE
jgi:hypothetical protein